MTLGVFAGSLRAGKLLGLTVWPDLHEWVVAMGVELAFVLLFEATLLLIALPIHRRRWRFPTRAVWMGLQGAVMLALLIDHQFYSKTGSGVRLTEVIYALRNFKQLLGLLGSGADGELALWTAFAIGLQCACWRYGSAPRTEGARLSPRFAGLTSALLGSAILAFGSGYTPYFPFRSASLLDVFWAKRPLKRKPPVVSAPPSYKQPSLTVTPPARRPNIVLVVAESTRAEVLTQRVPRSGPPPMPFLNELAETGVVIENAYTTIPHTSKALVGLLCGMYPRIEMEIWESRSGKLPLTCLPHFLEALGYRTAFLQTALGSFENRPGLAQNLGFTHISTQENMETAFAKYGYLGMDEFAMLEPATSWAISRDERPYFLTVLTVTTHHPYEVPGDAPKPPSELQAYARALRHVDGFIENLHQRLVSATPSRSETVFIVVGDHGEAFGEHQRRQHDVVPYEEVLNVPWLIHGPSWIGLPRRVQGLRSHLDLLPTVLEWLEVEHDGVLPGIPLSDFTGHEVVSSFCWYDNACAALRKGNNKLVYHYELKPTEIYDLGADPLEKQDLSKSLASEQLDAAVHELLRIRSGVDAYYAQHRGH